MNHTSTMRTAILAALILAAAPAQAAQWQVDAAKSKLGFMLTWDREPFRASFRKWSAAIDFDPADLAHAKADVAIDIGSLASEDPKNDRYRNGPNGLDVMHFPQARFVTKSIREVTPNHYEATADLSIRGITKEVTLPFTLTIAGTAAHMTGELTLSRVDFGVGLGRTFGIDWSSERTVSHAVKVTIDLTATKKP
jgi:polyisoprenoid-binding protein YceI